MILPDEIIAAEAFVRSGGGVAILSDDEAGQRVMQWLAEHCQADPDDWDWIGIARAGDVDHSGGHYGRFKGNASSLWRLTSGNAFSVCVFPVPSTSLVAVVSYHG